MPLWFIACGWCCGAKVAARAGLLLAIFNEQKKSSTKKLKSIQIFICYGNADRVLACWLPSVSSDALSACLGMGASAGTPVCRHLRASVIQYNRNARRGVAPVPRTVSAGSRQADQRVARGTNAIVEHAVRTEDITTRFGVHERLHVSPRRVYPHLRAVSGGAVNDTLKQFSGATSVNVFHSSKRHNGIFLNAAVQSAESSSACLRMVVCSHSNNNNKKI